MCRDCHHHAHGAVGPHRRIGLLKIQALLLSVSTGHQTCLVPPIPLDLKDEEAGQRLLPFRQINLLLPHPKLHARFQLLINGYPPPASIRTRMRLSHCQRRQCVAVRAWGGRSCCKGCRVFSDILTPGAASNLLEGCHRLRPNWSLQLPPPRRLQWSCQQNRAALAANNTAPHLPTSLVLLAGILRPLPCRLHPGFGGLASLQNIGHLAPPSSPCLGSCSPRLPFSAICCKSSKGQYLAYK
jgi:hypothetical protein